MVHVVDADEELIFAFDHNPPMPTTQWKPGQTIEYTQDGLRPGLPVRRRGDDPGRPVLDDDAEAAAAGGRGRRAARLQGGEAPAAAADRERLHGLQGRLAPGRDRRAQRHGRVAVDQEGRDARRSRTRRRTASSTSTSTIPAACSTSRSRCKVSAGRRRWSTSSRSSRSSRSCGRFRSRRRSLATATWRSSSFRSIRRSCRLCLSPGNKDPRELGVRVFHAFVDPR